MPTIQERLFQIKNLIEQLLWLVNCHSFISALNRGPCSANLLLLLFPWVLDPGAQIKITQTRTPSIVSKYWWKCQPMRNQIVSRGNHRIMVRNKGASVSRPWFRLDFLVSGDDWMVSFQITQGYLRISFIPCGSHAILSVHQIQSTSTVSCIHCCVLYWPRGGETQPHRGNSSRAGEVDGLIRLGRPYSTLLLVGWVVICGPAPSYPWFSQLMVWASQRPWLVLRSTCNKGSNYFNIVHRVSR